jgi:general secretion pathway protein D
VITSWPKRGRIHRKLDLPAVRGRDPQGPPGVDAVDGELVASGVPDRQQVGAEVSETSVVLLNNQTLVLGELIQNKRTFNRTGIPFLNRIPVLGLLFGSIEEKIEKTELVLLITPRVVGTALDAARITDQMRRVTPELEDSIRRAPRPPSPPPAH